MKAQQASSSSMPQTLPSVAKRGRETDVTGAFESGSVVLLTGLGFPLLPSETAFLDPRILGKAKNVSYQPKTGQVSGHKLGVDGQLEGLRAMLDRYSKLGGKRRLLPFPRIRGEVSP